ncbi:MAG TPA: endopeptidase La [Gaiellaceae bacterium]|jgi:ATP-dependent Lon protease|nr:endopeptidase La [Gaiellaceae bacterium]
MSEPEPEYQVVVSAEEQAQAEELGEELPAALPVLPLKETVVFPESMTPLAIGQERSIKLIDDVIGGDRLLALVTVRVGDEGEPETPGWDDLYGVGTAAVVHKMIRVPDGTLRVLVQGLRRISLQRRVLDDPYLVGEFVELADVLHESKETEALTRNVQGLFARIIGLVPYLPEELQIAAANVDEPSALCHLVASTLRLKTEEKQKLLGLVDVGDRLREVSLILNRELEVFELGTKIQSQVQSELEKGQREFFLRQQLKAIQEELGESDPEQAETAELRTRLEELDLPEEVGKAAFRELGRLERLPSAAAEYGVIRTYLDWIVTLPWNLTTTDNLDLDRARRVLDEDHYDLEKVKERIVEHLAVSKLRRDPSGQILCFVGPPGVGKTSLGQSIARTLERKFARLSVGGVRDEAEVRGHRRTYIGAMPGSIIRALRDAESMNPVLLVDEIDKMGSDVRGDPASAMLEVLDPEQNRAFRDHYLDLPFDLSKVLFICTANTTDTIPGPLLDRMDVIALSGYTEEEKLGIARPYLVPKQIDAHGLNAEQLQIGGDALRLVIREYTREAGVRGLERRVADLCRKAALKVAEGFDGAIDVDEALVREWLGPRRFSSEARRRTADPGVATGLAYTAAGGDVLFIEAQAYPGKGRLTITGQLGEVMQESAQAALSWVRSHTAELGLPESWFAEHDVHIHVPAGAVPKDGPSAGVTMATAIASLIRGLPVADDVGMTGEITLTGQVLPIGGVREKALAAQRSGLRRMILPSENEVDLDELPDETRRELEFIPVDSIQQVLDVAFAGSAKGAPRRAAGVERQAASPG